MVNYKILPNKIDLTIVFLLLATIATLIFFNNTNIDLAFQSYFFDFTKKKWLIDKYEPVKKFFFYQLPKIFFAITLILTIIIFSRNKNIEQHSKLLVSILAMIFIPLIAANIKKFTNVYCPNQLSIYDGDKPYIKILQPYPKDFFATKKGQCFPAGHVVTGFAFYIFAIFLSNYWQKIIYFIFITCFSWLLGLYQIAKGVHFLSDTVIANMICLLLTLLAIKIQQKYAKQNRYKNIFA